MNLREAAQQALEYIEQHAIISGAPIRDALRAALEPVTTGHELSKEGDKLSLPFNHFADAGKMVATINKMETVEPVAWCIVENGRVKGLVKSKPAVMNAYLWQPLYTAPPKRKPLTEDEIDKAWRSVDYKISYDNFRIEVARAIERAHGIGGEE